MVVLDKGISEPIFKPSRLAINQEAYHMKCLSIIWIPLIWNHYQDG